MPVGYPLPWCDMLDVPYWRINAFLCNFRAGWREWQAGLPMSRIIPEIDALLAPPA
jgi:hypothetical protein